MNWYMTDRYISGWQKLKMNYDITENVPEIYSLTCIDNSGDYDVSSGLENLNKVP